MKYYIEIVEIIAVNAKDDKEAKAIVSSEINAREHKGNMVFGYWCCDTNKDRNIKEFMVK